MYNKHTHKRGSEVYRVKEITLLHTETNRQTYTQTQPQTDIYTDTATDRHIYTQTQPQTDSQTHTHTQT